MLSLASSCTCSQLWIGFVCKYLNYICKVSPPLILLLCVTLKFSLVEFSHSQVIKTLFQELFASWYDSWLVLLRATWAFPVTCTCNHWSLAVSSYSLTMVTHSNVLSTKTSFSWEYFRYRMSGQADCWLSHSSFLVIVPQLKGGEHIEKPQQQQ